MATPLPSLRPLTRLKPLIRHTRACQPQCRFLNTQQKRAEGLVETPEDLEFLSEKEGKKLMRNGDEKAKVKKAKLQDNEWTAWKPVSKRLHTTPRGPPKIIPVHSSTQPIHKKCPDPIALINATQIRLLDPTGARSRLFSKTNPEAARVGDVLLVRLKNGDPFAGICMNIRRRGVDTAILLRGQLTRVGVEMWYKIYSPNVEGIEVVQRARKRARRARLYYLRSKRHDRGSVENVVRTYLRQRAALGVGGKSGGGKAAGGNKRGKKR